MLSMIVSLIISTDFNWICIVIFILMLTTIHVNKPIRDLHSMKIFEVELYMAEEG